MLDAIIAKMPEAAGEEILMEYRDCCEDEDECKREIEWGMATLRALGYYFEE